MPHLPEFRVWWVGELVVSFGALDMSSDFQPPGGGTLLFWSGKVVWNGSHLDFSQEKWLKMSMSIR